MGDDDDDDDGGVGVVLAFAVLMVAYAPHGWRFFLLSSPWHGGFGGVAVILLLFAVVVAAAFPLSISLSSCRCRCQMARSVDGGVISRRQ